VGELGSILDKYDNWLSTPEEVNISKEFLFTVFPNAARLVAV
jgi:hypothetical protein